MRGLATLFVIASLFCALDSGVASAIYVETFDTDAAGWEVGTVNDDAEIKVSQATYQSTNGNPGGHISGALMDSPDRLYGFQPSDTSVYGDMTGLTMTVDFKLDGIVDEPANPRVRFYVGTVTGGYDYYATNDTYSWNPNGETSWITHQVLLTSANFIQWPVEIAGLKTFDEIIAAPEDIGLVFVDGAGCLGISTQMGFSSDAGATIFVDNFGVVPEPATICLLGLGGLALLSRKR